MIQVIISRYESTGLEHCIFVLNVYLYLISIYYNSVSVTSLTYKKGTSDLTIIIIIDYYLTNYSDHPPTYIYHEAAASNKTLSRVTNQSQKRDGKKEYPSVKRIQCFKIYHNYFCLWEIIVATDYRRHICQMLLERCTIQMH